MSIDIEATLARELHQVADGVEVPALPQLPSEPPTRRVWQPLLVAAAVVLIVLGAVAAVVTLTGGDDEIQPAPPSPTLVTEDPTEDAAAPEPLTTEPPGIPYVVDGQLFVAGEQVPGESWAFVKGTDTGWLAGRFENGEYSYAWGYDAEPHPIEGAFSQGVEASPDGHYWAGILAQDLLTGADTEAGGEGFGGTPFDAVTRSGGSPWVAAVTNDGLVVTGNGPPILWRPLVDGETVDLADTAPDRVVLGATEAGVLVVDASSTDSVDQGRYGDVYLAEISEDGEITRTGPVPNHDDLVASGSWLAWVPVGSLGGEVTAVGALEVQRLDGSEAGTLTPPRGWSFRVHSWTWEDDDHLIASVYDDGDVHERMVRCSPATQECVLLDGR